MNLTRFAENLLEALGKPEDPDKVMERLENVLYALEYGKQREAWRDWDAMQREADMEDVEYLSRVLVNPISHCPRDIRIAKDRLRKKVVEILESLAITRNSGWLKEGEDPIWGWPDPLRIFEECRDFAERIAEEESPSETSAPPVAGESDGTIFGIDCAAIHKAFTDKKGFSSTIRTRLQNGKKREGKPIVKLLGKGKSKSGQLVHVYDYEVVTNILWDEYQSDAKSSLNTKKKILKALKKACRDFTVS